MALTKAMWKIAPHVLTPWQKARFAATYALRKLLGPDAAPAYTPKFSGPVQHFLLHAGGWSSTSPATRALSGGSRLCVLCTCPAACEWGGRADRVCYAYVLLHASGEAAQIVCAMHVSCCMRVVRPRRLCVLCTCPAAYKWTGSTYARPRVHALPEHG